MKIEVKLPTDRTHLGNLLLLNDDGDIVLGPVPCLANSDSEYAQINGNPTRDPLKRGGDTPLGQWTATWEKFTGSVGESVEHSYGPHGKVHLHATGGDALTAQNNGRTGICIHSGPLNPAYTATLGLRPTHGCIRIMDEPMLDLLTEMAAHDGSVTCDTMAA